MLFPTIDELLTEAAAYLVQDLPKQCTITKTKHRNYCPSSFDAWHTACAEDYMESYEENVNTDLDDCLNVIKEYMQNYHYEHGFHNKQEIHEFVKDVTSESLNSYLQDLIA